MKRGYKRLLIFELAIFVILILNSFVWNILNGFLMSLFLLCALVLFKPLFGYEKDKHRYTKDILLEVLIFLATFFILYYLLGILISFYKIDNYFTILGLTKFILPAITYVILKEFLRYMVMCKAEGSKILFITSLVMFIFMDVTTAIYVKDFNSVYAVFIFIAASLLPSISSNIVFSYYTTRIGYKPIMVYSLIMSTYMYILPIVPNPNEYLTAVIQFLLPVALGFRLYKFLSEYKKREVTRDYNKRKFTPFILTGLSVIILVYFTSGYFHFWAIAVASGSMKPKINKGDVAIIEKVKNPDTLKEGQVIAYKYEDIIIVHRLIEKIEVDGKYYFYTKGDANSVKDGYVIKKNMIVGKVEHKIPFIGIPTVWLNKLL